MNSIISAAPIFGPASSWAYGILKHVEPGLLLDIGAAKGSMTQRMLGYSPTSQVIAYEPFPGNWRLFERETADKSNVSLRRKAVSDHAGKFQFSVPSTVQGTESGWSNDVGYSSVGYLVDDKHPAGKNTIDVETVTLADEALGHVRFMKIDVQGAEGAVLRGADPMIAAGEIDMILLEVDGDDPDIVDWISQRDYVAFDGGYCCIGPETPNWDVTYRTTLSTGAKAFGGWPIEYPRAPRAFCDWLVSQRSANRSGYTWCDLLFVAPHFLPDFMAAAAGAARRRPVPKSTATAPELA